MTSCEGSLFYSACWMYILLIYHLLVQKDKKEWRRQLLFYGFGLAIHWSKLRQEEMRWQDLLSHLVMIENKQRWLKQLGTTSTGKTYRDYSQGTTCFINYLKRPLEVGQRAAIICVINVSVIKSTCIFFKPLSPMWEVLKVRWYNINTIHYIVFLRMYHEQKATFQLLHLTW